MRDIILLISVMAFMIFGFFAVDKADEFSSEYYMGCEADNDEEREPDEKKQDKYIDIKQEK